jgi:monoterpene epsilon-lactone hydrolase
MPSLRAVISASMMRRFAKPRMAQGTLEQQRQRYLTWAGRKKPPQGTVIESVRKGDLEGERLTPPGSDSARALLWFFGGGYIAGSPITTRALAARIASSIGAWALVPAYRLRPEHSIHASLEDGLVAYRWLVQELGSADQIVVGGESAGGGLSLRLLCALRDADEPLPAAAVLISPSTDLAMSGQSMKTNSASDALASPAFLADVTERLDLADPRDPRVSPLYANLSKLPPLLIHVSGDEVLLDDSVRLADRAQAAGVEVTLHVFPGLWHVFHSQPSIPEAREAVKEIGAFARSRLTESSAFSEPRTASRSGTQ